MLHSSHLWPCYCLHVLFVNFLLRGGKDWPLEIRVLDQLSPQTLGYSQGAGCGACQEKMRIQVSLLNKMLGTQGWSEKAK